jgi:quercetin dioxygenase-like cupin family protein
MYTLHISQAQKAELQGRTSYRMVGYDGIKSDRMTFGVCCLPPLSKTNPHKHLDEEEIIYITEGFGRVHFEDGGIESIEPGTVIVAPKGVNHTIENISRNTMKWCFCFNPPVKSKSYAK